MSSRFHLKQLFNCVWIHIRWKPDEALWCPSLKAVFDTVIPPTLHTVRAEDALDVAHVDHHLFNKPWGHVSTIRFHQLQ